jgi:hypothetical protein
MLTASFGMGWLVYHNRLTPVLDDNHDASACPGANQPAVAAEPTQLISTNDLLVEPADDAWNIPIPSREKLQGQWAATGRWGAESDRLQSVTLKFHSNTITAYPTDIATFRLKVKEFSATIMCDVLFDTETRQVQFFAGSTLQRPEDVRARKEMFPEIPWREPRALGTAMLIAPNLLKVKLQFPSSPGGDVILFDTVMVRESSCSNKEP